MLYKFKSKAAGDLIMLEGAGQQVLEIIGKSPGATGIILPEQMPAAIEALQAAITSEEAEKDAAMAAAKAAGEPVPRFAPVSLRQRAHPFIGMLKLCLADKKEIVWGV
jgi:hypothetical protein